MKNIKLLMMVLISLFLMSSCCDTENYEWELKVFYQDGSIDTVNINTSYQYRNIFMYPPQIGLKDGCIRFYKPEFTNLRQIDVICNVRRYEILNKKINIKIKN